MVALERRNADAMDGLWLLKLAIFVGFLGLIATIVDQLAASVVLYVAALTAIGVFYRKWWRPGYRAAKDRYAKPLLRLAEHMDASERADAEHAAQLAAIQEQQAAMASQLDVAEGEVKNLVRQVGRIEKGQELNREQAADAVNIARAVQRAVGARARGDEEDK